jgi:hypothetical protein
MCFDLRLSSKPHRTLRPHYLELAVGSVQQLAVKHFSERDTQAALASGCGWVDDEIIAYYFDVEVIPGCRHSFFLFQKT